MISILSGSLDIHPPSFSCRIPTSRPLGEQIMTCGGVRVKGHVEMEVHDMFQRVTRGGDENAAMRDEV